MGSKGTFICILLGCTMHLLPAQKKIEVGFQLSPFALATSPMQQGLLLDSVLLQMMKAASSNPSLQAGFFANCEFSKRWSLRTEINLMHRAIFYSVSYPFRGFFSDMFTGAAIATTINTSGSWHYRLSPWFSVGAGLAGQFHFTSNRDIIPDPTNPAFAPLLNQVDRAVRPVTWHLQLSVLRRLNRWNLGLSWQRSLNSMTTSITYRGQEYPLPILMTEIYYLNIGYVLFPARKKAKQFGA